jgi:hypothetical protein
VLVGFDSVEDECVVVSATLQCLGEKSVQAPTGA